MNIFESFRCWWNGLAEDNGKVKFRNQREAEEFIRSLSNKAGPNRKIVRMRDEYIAVKAAQAKAEVDRTQERQSRAP